MKKYLALFALVAVIIGSTQSVYACSVVAGYPGTPAQNIANKDIAFIGTVQSVTKDTDGYSDYKLTFKNELTYKGSVPTTITLRSTSSSAACGYDDGAGTFGVGTVWMIYGSGNASDGYSTNAISLNTKYESVATAVKAMAVAGVVPPMVPGSVISGTLRVGSRGELVKTLQSTLNDRGYSVGTVDGIFGQMTKSAVMKYQATNSLAVDGIVGAQTAMSLARAVSQ